MAGDTYAQHNVLERILGGSEDPQAVPLDILESVTENFSEDRIIGQGGFGVVYKGVLENGFVAVKRINSERTLSNKLFTREVTSLLKVNHQNVVRFLGFFSSLQHVLQRVEGTPKLAYEGEKLLCFEYISNGSLNRHITDELSGLEWNVRYQIIKGICEGLQYLHDKGIKHMDLKPENILIDEHMVPKITDFGLARLDTKSRATTGALYKSRWYCAPEYVDDGKISPAYDIYSLGVIIMELITGLRAIPDNKYNVLRRWKCRWNELMRDTSLREQEVRKCIQIAEICREKDPNDRPSIRDVINRLNENGHISAVGQANFSLDDDMLWIRPLELRFAFERQTCVVELENVTRKCIAFKIEANCQLQHCTDPNNGIVLPRSKRDMKITLQTQETILPQDTRFRGQFIVHSVEVNEGLNDKDITERMFKYDSYGKVVDEVALPVVFESDETVKQHLYLTLEPQAECSEPVSEGIGNKDARRRPTKRQRLMQYPPRDKAQAVHLRTGAMGSLLPKLDLLLKQRQNNLETSVIKKEDVEYLKAKLGIMHKALCSVSEAKQDQLDLKDQLWARKIRELSYDTEDVVDDLLVRKEGTEHNHGIVEAISDVKHRVKEVFDDIMPDVQQVQVEVGNNVTSTIDDDPRMLDLWKDHKELVGIDDKRHELAKMITSVKDSDVNEKQLKIVSIFGQQGGLGKTTLAKAVYDKLSREFTLKAFVQVGRNPDVKTVLERILLELEMSCNVGWGERELIKELRGVLKDERYLIVIDDIWDVRLWKRIKRTIFGNDGGGRIITTTRNLDIARECDEVCKLEPLSVDHSMELFRTRLVNFKGKHTFDQLDDQCAKILQKCYGVPLAIITMAGILADKPRDDWPEVYDSIGFGNQDNIDVDINTRKILSYSYYNLPCYLKTCLVYLRTFPEYTEIEKDMLVWKWVAEGFVHEQPERSLFKVGEAYFNALINRGMIQPVSNYYTVYACRVHDMVLDLLLTVAKEENFVTTVDGDDRNLSSEGNPRRLVVHNSVLEKHDLVLDNTRTAKARSFSATRCRTRSCMTPRSFRVLRVLSIENCNAGKFSEVKPPKSVRIIDHDGLRYLRYLSLYRTSIDELPTKIGYLIFLQTLDLRDTSVSKLPPSFIQLRQLKCFRYEPMLGKIMTLPEGMGNLTCLEDLWLEGVHPITDITELGKLTELRVLKYAGPCYSNLDSSTFKAFKKSLSRLKKIEELELSSSLISKEESRYLPHSLDDLSPSSQLRHLKLGSGCYLRGLPGWLEPSRLPLLSLLEIRGLESLEARDLDNLGRFPELRCLELVVDEEKVFPIATGAFPKLRHCYMSSPMKYQPGAMPCLESVEFHIDVGALKATMFDFNFDTLLNLPLLEKVTADIDTRYVDTEKDVSKKTEAALRRVVDNHPNHPSLDLDPSDSRLMSPDNSSSDPEQTDAVNDEEVQDVLDSEESDHVEPDEEF